MSRSTAATHDAHAPASFKTFLTDIAGAYSTEMLQHFLQRLRNVVALTRDRFFACVHVCVAATAHRSLFTNTALLRHALP